MPERRRRRRRSSGESGGERPAAVASSAYGGTRGERSSAFGPATLSAVAATGTVGATATALSFAPTPEMSPRLSPVLSTLSTSTTPVLSPTAPAAAARTPSISRNKAGRRSPALQINTTPAPAGSSGGQGGGSAPTPILTHITPLPLPPPADQPEFAELLTPAQLRRRRRRAAPALPAMLGPSRLGFTTGDGDLYIGAASDPTAPAATPGAEADDDALTLSSGSSGSSSWSWGSGLGLDVGRRATMAVARRFGEAIGVRRGSVSSTETASSSSSSSASSADGRSRIGRIGRALSRTMSRATNESSPERRRRVYVPRRREFTLYTPQQKAETAAGAPGASGTSLTSLAQQVPTRALPPSATAADPRTSERVIVTPVLPPVLEAVRSARLAAGVVPTDPLAPHPQTRGHGHARTAPRTKSRLGPGEPVRRGGSVPGKKREFALPTVPRPPLVGAHSQSRIQALKASASASASGAAEAGAGMLRPKSASDLLGLTGPTTSGMPTTGLPGSGLMGSGLSMTGLAASASAPPFSLDDGIPTAPPKFASGPALTIDTSSDRESRDISPDMPTTPLPDDNPAPPKHRAAWWLDVSCPTWKDLRDIGELLGLHPLTLEDVLHQDPREKFEMYSKLGYYFIVVRALDEQYFKYTPGSSGPPGADLAAAAAAAARQAAAADGNGKQKPGSGTGDGTAPDLVTGHHDAAKRKERTRRGWGFGRATGRAASKVGEKVEIVEDNPGKEGLEGVGVGGVNLYLVVFADGIVSFHYEDVSKHTRRVLERILASRDDEATADWISHGLLDSIVDAFFPLIGYVDGAVDDMDSLTIDPRSDPRALTASGLGTAAGSAAGAGVGAGAGAAEGDGPYGPPKRASTGSVTLHGDNGNADGDTWIEMDDLDKAKHHQQSLTGHHLRQRGANAGRKAADIISGLRGRDGKVNDIPTEYLSGFAYRQSEKWTPWRLAVLYFKLFFLPVTDARESPHQSMGSKDSDLFDRSTMLRSMTNMRRLVTGLSRLLVGKHAVVASLLKRAHESRAGGDDEAYLSDVADHILLLQTSLYHYEYILSHCQPAYLSYLNVSSAQSRGGTDVLILTLSTVSIGILPMQLFIGMFSMNIKVPHNGLREGTHLEPDGSVAPHNYFAGICVGIFFIGCGLVLVVRWWRWLARKKWTELRGGELPPTWDGFWGWY